VLSLETPLYELVGSQLAAMGHTVQSVSGGDVGGVQTIMVLDGTYRSGSDFRKDGAAVGW
jgi:gamma-glutamyltranspeptidase/glutathione hydrolase